MCLGTRCVEAYRGRRTVQLSCNGPLTIAGYAAFERLHTRILWPRSTCVYSVNTGWFTSHFPVLYPDAMMYPPRCAPAFSWILLLWWQQSPTGTVAVLSYFRSTYHTCDVLREYDTYVNMYTLKVCASATSLLYLYTHLQVDYYQACADARPMSSIDMQCGYSI